MVESFDVFEDLVGQWKVLLGNILQSPKLHLIVRIHSGSFIEKILFGWRHSAAQPSLMNYGWYNGFCLFLNKGSELASLIENNQFFKWHFIPDNILKIAMHALHLDASESPLQLLFINFFYFISNNRKIVQKHSFSRNVEHGCIFADYVEFFRFGYIISD